MSPISDYDSAESETSRDSFIENIGEDSKAPSPKSASRRYHHKLSEIVATMPHGQAKLESVLFGRGGGEFRVDEYSNFANERQLTCTSRIPKKKKKFLDDVEMGGVILDSNLGGYQSNPAFTRYWLWQVERHSALQSAETIAAGSQEVPLSNMGLFALLPGEMRNKIYRMALVEVNGPFMIVGRPNECSLGPCTHTKLPLAAPGILSACKQVRREAMPIFCAENTLKFDARTVRGRCTANFLRAIGAYGGLIRNMVLEVEVMEYDASQGEIFQWATPCEIRVECPTETNPQFGGEIDGTITSRTKVAGQVAAHLMELGERLETEPMELLLLEFVWSDLLAELVYICSKRARA